ncbi:ATP-binding protein [Streptacidiphilus melanogenes]|uniref:ATP-binding protein n=1 Tax=Streptacidiphilus melanogenes TaxID=411235 RepID=UPI000694FAE8|nr:ATP-binding protein [Streptacidiphilus melanogenes]
MRSKPITTTANTPKTVKSSHTNGPALKRRVFSTPRNTEFLTVRGLEAQTGQPEHHFDRVVIKELLDNALDAAETAETAGGRPEVGLAVARTDGVARVTVTDNGAGIPAGVVERLLDFNVNVSDKEAVRSPTRGLQGNAMKTLLGMPYALKVHAPVVIEAQGVRHEISVSLDPGRNVVTRHATAASDRTVGTSVTVPLPADLLGLDEPAQWMRNFALANPHARLRFEHGQAALREGVVIYEPTAPAKWRKPMPGDATSAHHYTEDAMKALVFGHIREYRHGGRDVPLREFVGGFTGLSGTVKAKLVAARLPGISHLSGFEDQPEQVAVLLAAMREHSTPPGPAYLGKISRDHYTQALDRAFGVEESWFARKTLTDKAGIPWVIEVTIARTERPGAVCFAVNYSPSFGDPLARTYLAGDTVRTQGTTSFLTSCDAAPEHGNQDLRAAVVHLICPVPRFMDKGKVALDVPPEVADACAQALTTATTTLHKAKLAAQRARDAVLEAEKKAEATERKARQRDAEDAARARRAGEMTKKDAVFAVLPTAIAQVSGEDGLSFSSHTLFYKIRPLALKHLPQGTRLDASYVEQRLIPDWEREMGPIPGLYREPRGTLHHPHDKDGSQDVRLGTLAVARYVPENWNYNKILIIEKAGLWPPVHESGIAERYDMAVIITEGYSTEACRDLLAKLTAGDVQIFVLHDADIDGYNIARTLGEETDRMPDHRVEVISLGLHVEDAEARGLETEPFVRDKALPTQLAQQLSPTALAWFTGKPTEWDRHGKAKKWLGKRVELNAFTSPELIAYIEEQLTRHGATGKVIPTDDVLRFRSHLNLGADVDGIVDRVIAELIDRQEISAQILATLDLDALSADTRTDIARYLAKWPNTSWDTALSNILSNRLRPHRPELEALTRQLLTEQGNTENR